MVVVEGKVEVEETASRSLVSHAIERDLNTSFVHGGKAKRFVAMGRMRMDGQ
jgi:hypothetical protein